MKKNFFHQLRKVAIYSMMPLVVLFALSQFSVEAQQPPTKRLKRIYQVCGPVDDHPCTVEYKYRQEDFLASFDDEDIAEFEERAKNGDADAMFLLSQIPREDAERNRTYPYRDKWLTRAAEAGHAIARYQLGEIAHQKGEISDEEFLKLAEAAAQIEPGGDLAWRLGFSYGSAGIENTDNRGCSYWVEVKGPPRDYKYLNAKWIPRNFIFLKGDPEKALYWTRLAAEKGNVMAAERLCLSYYNYNNGWPEFGINGPDETEALRWCTQAAFSSCSNVGASAMSDLYRTGFVFQKNKVAETFWLRIEANRVEKLRGLNPSEWEYIIDGEQ